MSRILLVDDSPHAQRMGESILTGEGFEVVTVSNADTALVRIEDVDPDVVIADTVMPGRTGYEICQYLKMSPRHRHVRVILTAGVLEPIDEALLQRVQADASLKKPFEATALIEVVRQMAADAAKDRKQSAGGAKAPPVATAPSAPFVAVVDAEQVRAAVMVALDASMEAMAEEIARRVIATLQTKKSEAPKTEAPPERTARPAAPSAAQPAAPSAPQPHGTSPVVVRRVTPLRVRGSILGLDVERPDESD